MRHSSSYERCLALKWNTILQSLEARSESKRRVESCENVAAMIRT